MSIPHHNWNQFHRVLTNNLGYRQVISSKNGVISYRSPNGRKLVIKKSNRMSIDYVHAILWEIGLDYNAFVKYYSVGHL